MEKLDLWLGTQSAYDALMFAEVQKVKAMATPDYKAWFDDDEDERCAGSCWLRNDDPLATDAELRVLLEAELYERDELLLLYVLVSGE